MLAVRERLGETRVNRAVSELSHSWGARERTVQTHSRQDRYGC